MSIEPKLEEYLNTLDKALGQIPVSDRAEIVTEIKSHVLESRNKNPDQDITAILASLGEPESVANRYLLERGLKVSKPTKTPMVKWLTIGFLGTLSVFALLLVILVWKFTPIISINEAEERVTILGGLIDVNGKKGRVRWGSKSVDIEGAKEVGKSVKEVSLTFTNGTFQLSSGSQKDIRWQCQTGTPGAPLFYENQGVLNLSFNKLEGVACKVQLPGSLKMSIQGANGQLEISKPQADLKIRLDNGQVKISPDSQLNYKYEVHVVNGYADSFSSSDSKDARQIKIDVTNGYIELD